MTVLAILGGAMLALVAWYMRRPDYRILRLSAARFLGVPPAPQTPRQRWSPGAPLKKWRFFLRAALLGLIATACVQTLLAESGAEKAVRLALVVDVSNSMGSASGERTPLAHAMDKLRELADRLDTYSDEAEICVVLRTVGSSIGEDDLRPHSTIRDLELNVERESGTATLLMEAAQLVHEDCLPTHAVVLTDHPAPADPSVRFGEHLIWLDVAAPANNVGISGIRDADAGFGRIAQPVVEIAQFGAKPEALHLIVESSRGRHNIQIDTSVPGPWRIPLVAESGRMVLSLSPGGAYSGDDRIVADIHVSEPMRVVWRIKERDMPAIPGWTKVEAEPDRIVDLVVQPISYGEQLRADLEASTPGVFVYQGLKLSQRPTGDQRIGLFVENIPLLEGVSLDVLEAAMRPLREPPPSGFTPVLRDEHGRTVLALRASPRAAIVPAPVPAENWEVEKLGLTLFYNALRWAARADKAVIEFHHVDAQRRTIPDADLESNTAEPQKSVGALNLIQPVVISGAREPVWPWIAALATLLFFVERLVGVDWRGREP